jgi:hypothetical protein
MDAGPRAARRDPRIGVRRMLHVALAGWLALVLVVTLWPAGGANHVALVPWDANQANAFNVVGNVVLFAVPAGLLFRLGSRFWRTVVAGLVLSIAIELVQLAIPGRTTSSTDVICNTVGAAAGWLAAWRRVTRSRT